MAVLKHIKSRNADYSAAIDYLLFQHDEKTGKKILDEFDRNILREEFYMDGLNCAPMSFDKECQITNTRFHKNQKTSEIKSHHYIISFDPADGSKCGLTGEKAQALCLELAKKIFPGYQALVVTHTDGHNASGNVHTHIVINSVQKYSAEREPYMSQPHDHEAGYKHRSTNKFLKYFKQDVMDMCHREGLHQIDLLQPAEVKITQAEYMAKLSGQELLEQYQISVTEHRGRYSYLHPDRQKRISKRSLGARYGKQYLEQTFLQKDPMAVLYLRSHLRLVVDLQSNVKAM